MARPVCILTPSTPRHSGRALGRRPCNRRTNSLRAGWRGSSKLPSEDGKRLSGFGQPVRGHSWTASSAPSLLWAFWSGDGSSRSATSITTQSCGLSPISGSGQVFCLRYWLAGFTESWPCGPYIALVTAQLREAPSESAQQARCRQGRVRRSVACWTRLPRPA